jgi:uroporphyrinogen-III decarboxylase
MNNRERILAILNRQAPDRLPWIPRLELWYNARVMTGTMPQEWRGLSLREVERKLGVGTPARDGRIFEVQYPGVQVSTWDEGAKRILEYRTPLGAVRQVTGFSETLDRQGLPGRVEEHLLKGPEDYRVWEWMLERCRYVPTYDAFRSYDAQIGGDGLPLVPAGENPFYEFLEVLAGYQDAFYQLADHPREVERLLTVMAEVHRERLWPVVADSPAQLLLNGSHLSSQFTPPALFEKHILPYYQEFIPLMHERGKWVAMHADADASRILALIERAGWDMVECFVTAPMVPLTLAQAREAWEERVIIWGGLPSLLLSPSVPEKEFRAYVLELFDIIAPGDAFILGVADNVMPDSLIDRIAWVSEQVEARGWYPIGA